MPFDFDDDERLPVEQLTTPVIAVRARILLADFRSRAGLHKFGGPLALDVLSGATRAPTLHRVLTLDLTDPLLGFSIDGVGELPLVYGFVHDGCRLRYRIVADGQIELLEAPAGAPASDWPYANYPAAFSEKRFSLIDDGAIEPDQVEELTWQGIEKLDLAEGVVALVPPSTSYGLSLWGEDGDDELVQVVFGIDPNQRIITAYNQCG